MMLEIEKAEDRVAILSASLPEFAKKVQELQSEDAKFGEIEGKGCSPLFLAVRFGKAVGIVEGANSPALIALINEQIPNIADSGDAE